MFKLLNTFNRIRIGFTLSILLLVTTSVLSFIICTNFFKKIWQINQTSTIINHIEDLRLTLKETESNLRAYSISNDTIYLIPTLEEQQQKVTAHIKDIKETVEEEKMEPVLAKNLEEKLDARFAFWKTLRKDPACLKKKSCFMEDNRQMNELEVALTQIAYKHKKLLIERNRIYSNYSDFLIPIILITSLVGIVISIFSYMSLKTEISTKEENLAKLNSLKTELEHKIQSLNRSNYELDQFAYVASHDLQEPLRKIISFSEVLGDEKKSELSDLSKSYLKIISKASFRMKQLIEDLLSYSRLAQNDNINYEQVALVGVLNSILKDLEIPIKEKHMNIYITELPPVWGIKFQINQLFLNLISNSLKYSSPKRQPVININHQIIKGELISEFPAIADNQYCKIEVIDNGIGFENKYAQDIFMIFNRLHGRNEYEGTGIGLSICKRVVENHKGFIQAFGKEDEGATFKIYLPIKSNNTHA